METVVVPREHPTKYKKMPEGLVGYWWETKHLICIPDIYSNFEGRGNFSRWLSELEAKGKVIFFPTIVSARLDSILRRRGYIDALSELSDEEKSIFQRTYCDGLALFPKGGLSSDKG